MGAKKDLDDLWERAPSRPRRSRISGSEDDRLHRISRGDRRAANGLVDRHLGPTWHLALVLTADTDDAQAVVERAWVSIHGQRPKDYHLALLEAVLEEWAAIPANGDSDVSATRRPGGAVLLAFLALPPAQRLAWWLHTVQVMPLEVVSELIGLGPVRTREVLQAMDESVLGAILGALLDGADTTCTRAATRFIPYVMGSLNRNDLRLLHGHVGSCAACAARLDAMEDPAGTLLELMPAPSDELRDHLRQLVLPLK